MGNGVIFRTNFPPHPPLGDHEVHLWRACRAEHEISRSREILSPEETARADRFVFPIHRERFTIFRAILREILAIYTAVPPPRLLIEYAGHGKPFLPGHDLGFNLAHSHDLMTLAVCRRAEIGMDIEKMDDRLQMVAIARRFFDSADRESVEMASDQERPAVFFAAWTAREAVLKATGAGLGKLASVAKLATEWETRHFLPIEGYAGCVALKTGYSITESFHFPGAAAS